MIIRPLTEEDAASYQELRVRALREEPVAFLSSPADEEGRALAEIEARVTAAADGSKCVFGAFAPDSRQLVGTLTFIRQAREKARHAAELCGMNGDAPGREERCWTRRWLMPAPCPDCAR